MELCDSVQGCLFSSIFCVTKTCYVAMPSGYKLVITCTCTWDAWHILHSGLTPSCFSAIYAIHPSCPCYNYNIVVSSALVTRALAIGCKSEIKTAKRHCRMHDFEVLMMQCIIVTMTSTLCVLVHGCC